MDVIRPAREKIADILGGSEHLALGAIQSCNPPLAELVLHSGGALHQR